MAKVMEDAKAVAKGQYNKAQNFKFRGIDDVYNELHDIFAKHQVFIVPEVVHHECRCRDKIIIRGGQREKGVQYHHFLTIRFVFYTTDGSSVMAVGRGEAMDSYDKGCNKAISIALKYVILPGLLIPTDETADPDAETPDETAPAPDNWRDVKIHFGKNKGVELGNLTENQLRWYVEDWNEGGSYEDAQLREALNKAKGALTPDPQAKLEAPAHSPGNGWRSFPVPAGKNKGKPLGSLESRSLEWYIKNWDVKASSPQEQKDFRAALDEAKAELYVTPDNLPENQEAQDSSPDGDDAPAGQEIQDPGPDDDVPF